MAENTVCVERILEKLHEKDVFHNYSLKYTESSKINF